MASVESSSKIPQRSTLKTSPTVPTSKTEELNEESLHSYHMWLKEKQIRDEVDDNNKKVKTENNNNNNNNDDDDSNNSDNDNFRVDVVLERGPSPPESDNASTYEWSYEEQFKQLYEIDDDAERKIFLDEYFEFMKGRGTPVSRIPIMAKQILDLFQLYNLVVKHGGLVQVIRNKQWSKITKGLSLPTSITSAAFTLRTQYLKYLYPYECAMHNFSTPKELQAAIDSNRRDRFSSLYHTEPTMTPSRDDRYSPFPFTNGDYPGAPPPSRHMPHPPLTPSQMEMRFNLKRPSDAMLSKSYEKYAMESPNVIVLQDSTPSLSENRSGKITPPPYHNRSRSPSSSDMRAIAEIEARRRSHHFPYGKEWEGDTRHVIEEEARRRMIDDSRKNSTSTPCKDKNCNGIDCHYARPEMHRHRLHDPMMVCACTYCKDYASRPYSPTRREFARHHMDGASANNHDLRLNGHTTPSSAGGHRETNGFPHQNNHHSDNNEIEKPTTTLRMKLPDVRRGGDSIFISLEVEGTVYEGTITSRLQQQQQQTNPHDQQVSQTPQVQQHLTNGNSLNNFENPTEQNNKIE